MPGLMGSGPTGNGPMTGRGKGRCQGGYAVRDTFYENGRTPRRKNSCFGMGRGVKHGRFGGWSNQFAEFENTPEARK